MNVLVLYNFDWSVAISKKTPIGQLLIKSHILVQVTVMLKSSVYILNHLLPITVKSALVTTYIHQ